MYVLIMRVTELVLRSRLLIIQYNIEDYLLSDKWSKAAWGRGPSCGSGCNDSDNGLL